MWVVIGAAGQLGRSLLSALSDAEVDSVALTKADCDVTAEANVYSVLSRLKPSVVVNTAAWTAVDLAEDCLDEAKLVNEIGARNVALACRAIGTTLMHISTDYVFDGKARSPIPEDSNCAPNTVYGKTKRGGELAVLGEFGHMSYVVRTAWLYSEYGSNFAKTMMRRALAGAPVSVVNDQVGQPTNSHDLARHLIDLVTMRAPHGIYHGTNSGEASWFEFAQHIYTMIGADTRLVSPIDTENYPTKAKRPSYSVLSHSRTVAQGIGEMRHWKIALEASKDAMRDQIRNEGH